MNIFLTYRLHCYTHFPKLLIVLGCPLLLQKEKQSNESELTNISEKQNFKNENLKIFFKDYYFSNVVARSSKTMIECNNAKINLKSTGTEG